MIIQRALSWFKKTPSWLKGGIIGLGIYILSLLIVIALFTLGSPILDNHPVPPGSLGFLIPFVIISLYPGLLFAPSYDALAVIIPINIILYFLGGAILGTFFEKRK